MPATRARYGSALQKDEWWALAAFARSMPNAFMVPWSRTRCLKSKVLWEMNLGLTHLASEHDGSLYLLLTPSGPVTFRVRPDTARNRPKNTGIWSRSGRQPPSGLIWCSL